MSELIESYKVYDDNGKVVGEVKHSQGWLTQEAAEHFKGKMADPNVPGAWVEIPKESKP